jgi:UrcA family protein
MNSLRIKESIMNTRLIFSFVSGAFLALSATALVFKTDPAIAQQAAEEVIEEIVVEAPIVRHQVGRTSIGVKIEVIELKRRVSYADLDLVKYADVNELKARIKTTAKESCEKLSDMFPLAEPTGGKGIRSCTDKAVAGTEEQVQAAIAAAS